MFEPGERVFLPGASGEPSAIVKSLWASDADILTSFVPGINKVPHRASGRTAGLFGQTGTVALPTSYGAFARDLGGRVSIDTAIVQVSPPDKLGRVSLGPAVEFAPTALHAARRSIAVMNSAVAFSDSAPTLKIGDFDDVIESDTPVREYTSGGTDQASSAIAANVAKLIEDGTALQVGLGKIPAALLPLLVDRKRLRIHSGMLSNGIDLLAHSGALAPDWRHLTTVFLGDQALYDWAAGQSLVKLAGCDVTHDPRELGAIDGLIAVNSALEVDLFGQCNLEWAAGRQVSGCGGAPDFARAGRLSHGGASIVALPSTFEGGSRIVSRLNLDATVAIPRHDIDFIVTEHGVADLRGKDSWQRAEAIIAIADPSAQAILEADWRNTGGRAQFVNKKEKDS